MSVSPSLTEPEADTGEVRRPHVRLDLIAGVVSLAIAAFFLLGAGSETLDWVFPRVLSYAIGAIGIVLLIRALFGYGGLVAAVPPILRGIGGDIATFIGAAIAYVVLLPLLGFWPVSGVMIFATSVFLARERSRRIVIISLSASIAACVLAYLLLERVFYVPFPRGRWLPF